LWRFVPCCHSRGDLHAICRAAQGHGVGYARFRGVRAPPIVKTALCRSAPSVAMLMSAFGLHLGLVSDIAPCRFCAKSGSGNVPIQKILIRTCEERRRDFDTERFRSLEIKSERVQRQRIRPMRSYSITMRQAAMTGLFRVIRDLSLLATRMAKPSGSGLFWRQKETFLT
jgi:hypothetical protein